MIVLGDFEEPAEAVTQVAGTLGLLDPDRPDADMRRARVFAGYAGWAPGLPVAVRRSSSLASRSPIGLRCASSRI